MKSNIPIFWLGYVSIVSLVYFYLGMLLGIDLLGFTDSSSFAAFGKTGETIRRILLISPLIVPFIAGPIAGGLSQGLPDAGPGTWKCVRNTIYSFVVVSALVHWAALYLIVGYSNVLAWEKSMGAYSEYKVRGLIYVVAPTLGTIAGLVGVGARR